LPRVCECTALQPRSSRMIITSPHCILSSIPSVHPKPSPRSSVFVFSAPKIPRFQFFSSFFSVVVWLSSLIQCYSYHLVLHV
jgi:hypothetical protein